MSQDGKVRLVLDSFPDGRTKQSFKDECDIQRIMERYAVTGVFYDRPGTRQARFGDFSGGLEYMEVQDRLMRAQEAFQALPARVRARFGNDPALLVEFLSDEENRAEAVELGLVEPEKPSSGTGPAGAKPDDVGPASRTAGTPAKPEGDPEGGRTTGT